jgi:hypothetical protein
MELSKNENQNIISEKLRQQMREANKRYQQTEKYKACRRRYYQANKKRLDAYRLNLLHSKKAMCANG